MSALSTQTFDPALLAITNRYYELIFHPSNPEKTEKNLNLLWKTQRMNGETIKGIFLSVRNKLNEGSLRSAKQSAKFKIEQEINRTIDPTFKSELEKIKANVEVILTKEFPAPQDGWITSLWGR